MTHVINNEQIERLQTFLVSFKTILCVLYGSSVSHVIGGTRQADEGMTAAL